VLDQHDVGALAAERREPGLAAPGLAHREPARGEQIADRRPDQGIVIDDQDRCGVGHAPIVGRFAQMVAARCEDCARRHLAITEREARRTRELRVRQI
jgi:hypothetical protein